MHLGKRAFFLVYLTFFESGLARTNMEIQTVITKDIYFKRKKKCSTNAAYAVHT